MADAVHQFDPDMAPDSAFVPGTLEHIVVGNRGRLMDPRRTPVTIVEVIPRTGHFVVMIEAFEDKGARWEVPFERIVSYQFEPESTPAPAAEAERFREIVQRLDQPFQLPCDPVAGTRTAVRLRKLQQDAAAWLRGHSIFLKQNGRLDTNSRRGSQELSADLQRFMSERDLLDLEAAFATCCVSSPRYCELEGHRMIIAELGLVPYEGTIVRDPALFDAPWTKERRAAHVLHRLAFLRALFSINGRSTVTLYRGLVFRGSPDAPRNRTFVSASFDFEVARSCFAPRETEKGGLIIRQVVPVDRLFMTYLETAEMNRQFLEAEAVILYEPGNPLF